MRKNTKKGQHELNYIIIDKCNINETIRCKPLIQEKKVRYFVLHTVYYYYKNYIEVYFLYFLGI